MPASRFRVLAVVTVVTTLILIALGGFVRAMEAGLGCPDWPTCFGALNPPSSLAWGELRLAWIEHSHRLVAAVVGLLVLALTVTAWRSRQSRPVRVATVVMLVAVTAQALVGALIIETRLDPRVVAGHAGGALVVLGLGLFVVARSGHAASFAVPSRASRLARLAATLTFGQMVLGSLVTGYEAGLSYTTFPLLAGGRVVPRLSDELRPWLHASHRLVAWMIATVVVALVLRLRRTGASRFAWLALGLVVVQVVLGALNVLLELSPWTVVPHLAVGSWLFAALVATALRCRPEPPAALRRLVPPAASTSVAPRIRARA
jgi:heme a synthase